MDKRQNMTDRSRRPGRWAGLALLGSLLLLPAELYAGDKPSRGSSSSPKASAPASPRVSAPSRSAPSRSSSSSRSKSSASRSRGSSRAKASKPAPSRSRSRAVESARSKTRSSSKATPSRSRSVESARQRADRPSSQRTLRYRRPTRDASPPPSASSPAPAAKPDVGELKTQIQNRRGAEGLDHRNPRFNRRIDDGSKTPPPYVAGVTRTGGVDRRRDYRPYAGHYGYYGSYRHHGHHGHHGYCPHFSHYGYGGFYLPIYGSYRSPVVYDHSHDAGPSSYDQLGALDLDVKPADAQIFIDGVFAGIADQYDGYPTYLWLDPGTHEVIFYQEGYETLVRHYTVYPEEVLKIEERLQPGEAIRPEELTGGSATEDPLDDYDPETAPAQPEPPTPTDHGRLVFSITPSDAAVYIDGHFIGTAGELAQVTSGLIVEPGDHEIEILRPGFDPERIPISVPPGERVDFELELRQP